MPKSDETPWTAEVFERLRPDGIEYRVTEKGEFRAFISVPDSEAGGRFLAEVLEALNSRSRPEPAGEGHQTRHRRIGDGWEGRTVSKHAKGERDPATSRAGDWTAGAGLLDASRDLYDRPKPRRKHSRDGSIQCPICAPLRCSRAGAP